MFKLKTVIMLIVKKKNFKRFKVLTNHIFLKYLMEN